MNISLIELARQTKNKRLTPLEGRLIRELARTKENLRKETERVSICIKATGFIVVGPSDNLSEVSQLINERNLLHEELAAMKSR